MLHIPGILSGLRPEGLLLVNTARAPAELELTIRPARVVTVPASDLARSRLGRPLPNTALLGALAGLTGVVALSALQEAIRTRFNGKAAELNASLAADGFRIACGYVAPGASHAQTG